jgi:serine phosphatase RsbU (regulator of sigma subunit)
LSWLGLTEAIVICAAATLVSLLVMSARERRARQRFRMLADVAVISDAGGDLEETLESICDVIVPDLADFCMIDLIRDGEVERAMVRLAPGGSADVETWLATRTPSLPDHMMAREGGATPWLFERMPDATLRALAHGAADLEMLQELAPRSTITVALNARGKVSGALTMGVAWSKRRYRRDDAHFAWILSGRVALTLDNCGLFDDLERAEDERAEIAETLQRGLLPPPLPDISGWSIAAMYQPAGAQNEVGGDFYDVFRVPGGWMLAIGDVTGRGAQAASITAVARYTLRTAAMLTDDPLIALATLNRALLARRDTSLCTVAIAVIAEDPAQPVRLAVAGHPPPLLVDGEEVTEVASSTDPVLGAFPTAEWSLARCQVLPGQQLVIVTDGIIEAKGPGGRFGESRLRSQLSGVGNPALALQRLEAALASFTDGRLEDDVAILVLSREAIRPAAVPEAPVEAAAAALAGLEADDVA